MALENIEVLANLKKQREAALEQLENIRATILKLNGAIDVLEQIEESKVEPVAQTEVVGNE